MVVSSVTPLIARGHPGPLRRVGLQRALQQAEHDRELGVRRRRRVRHLAGLLVLDALVQQHRGVAAVVEDHVRALRLAVGAVGPRHHLLGAPPVLLERLALPGEHRDALRVLDGAVRADGDGGRGVVLGGEDVAARPAHLGAELDERLDQHGGLDRHVQRAGDAGAGERLGRAELLAQGAQAGHLVLGEVDLLAAERGEREVGDAVSRGAPRVTMVIAGSSTGKAGMESGHRCARLSSGPVPAGNAQIQPVGTPV